MVLWRETQEPFGLHARKFPGLVIMLGEHRCTSRPWKSRPLASRDGFVIGGMRPHEYRALEEMRGINLLCHPARLQMDISGQAGLPVFQEPFTIEL